MKNTVQTKGFYSYFRPTRKASSLPPKIEEYVRKVTPDSMEEHVLASLQMGKRGEKYDTNVVIQQVQKFPKKNYSILAGENREVFYGGKIDWSKISSAEEPSCVVMCPPTYFFDISLSYSINAWMDKNAPVSQEAAIEQWTTLNKSIKGILPVDIMPPKKGFPDMVFVDQGLALPSLNGGKPLFIPSMMKTEERKEEVSGAIDFFKKRGYEILNLPAQPENIFFESNGDAHIIPGRALIFVGSGSRTSVQVPKMLEEIGQGYTVIPFALTDENGVYHLDTTSSVISQNTAIVFPNGFYPESFAIFTLFFKNFYLISSDEAREEFIPNSKQIGNTFFTQETTNENFISFIKSLPENEVKEIKEFDMTELNKSGGGINCCSKLAFHIPPTENT